MYTLGALTAATLMAGTTGALAKDEVVMAIPTFLTGAGGAAFGVPGKNGAELVIDAINAGTLPAPYNSKGLAGATIKPLVYDEAGGNTKQVTEMRTKAQKENVDVFVGYVSSGTCSAVSPVAEELKVLTILAVCGTPRVFEELVTEPKYLFRSMNTATASNVSLARYVAEKLKGKKGYTGINQNYAWGHDSWRDFDLAMKVVAPKMQQTSAPQFPKLFSGQYGTEVSALLRAPRTSSTRASGGGDLEALILQGSARGLFKDRTFLFTVGDSGVYTLGKKFPDGSLIGARGPYGIFASEKLDSSPLNAWFQKMYRERYKTQPTQSAYQYAQGVLAAKYAYDKAMKANGGKFPSTEQVIAALANSEFPTFSGTVKMAIGKGHQAITPDHWGVIAWDNAADEPTVAEVVKYPAECVNPPDNVDSVSWIKGGMKGAKC
ncbi:MAG: ABC transporter substrate-binding protein [Gammaproteobacteria bacterium]|nr:ABC transporter substrate-binding protein [Gammaproteobacteria bacterium]